MKLVQNRSSAAQRGFTVIELTVSLAVTVIILLAVLQLFDFSSKISRVQSNVADMQQSQRVVQYELTKILRMAGRGGLPAKDLPAAGFAVTVQDNVPAATRIGGGATEPVVAGTDILTVRGSFSNEPWQIEKGTTAYTFDPPTKTGFIVVKDTVLGHAQPLKALFDAINSNRPEALLLVGAISTNTYMMVELNPGASVPNSIPLVPPFPTSIKIAFKFTGDPYANAYQTFSSAGAGVVPADLAVAAGGAELSSIALIEEYRYYLREENEIPGDATSELIRHLTRAQTYPGTQLPYRGDAANWTLDIADNVLDLQAALGVNLPAGCLIENGGSTACTLTETANGTNDDWLLNEFPYVSPVPTAADADLRYVRVSTLVRTEKRDPTYEAPLIDHIENRAYAALSANTAREDRMFRRRVLQTVIDLRNL